jgi:hypothetical protein
VSQLSACSLDKQRKVPVQAVDILILSGVKTAHHGLSTGAFKLQTQLKSIN